MKRIVAMLLLALAVSSARAQAPDLDSKDYIFYNRFAASYENFGLSSNKVMFLGNKSLSLDGFGLEWVASIPFKKGFDMNLEFGTKFSMGWGSTSLSLLTEKTKMNLNLMRLAIPLRYVYNFKLADKMYISPYAGLDFKFNVLSKGKYTFYHDGEKVLEEKFDCFKRSDMDGERFRVFQLGWHIGLKYLFQNFQFTVSYGTDFINLYKNKLDGRNERINSANLSLGLGLFY